MKVVLVQNRKGQAAFLKFRKSIYKNQGIYIDNYYFMIKQAFRKKTSFIKDKEIYPLNVVSDDHQILCQGIIVYARDLPDYIQVSFFESLPGQQKAVSLLMEEAERIGRHFKCRKVVVGLNGHINYGLGLLKSHYDHVNSFSSSGNPKYYNHYFQRLGYSEVKLNTYLIHTIDNRLDKYKAIIDKINHSYTFKTFDRKKIDYYSKIYTDLNNQIFCDHKYYYKRTYTEDREMLKELFLFMKEDSLIFAFKNNVPIGFIMWYPDFNELAKKGDIFGVKHYIKNIWLNKKIKTAKIMEFGVLEEYRKVGLPLGLIDQVFNSIKNYHISRVETSWILDENTDSNSICSAICDKEYKEYVVYEKSIWQ